MRVGGIRNTILASVIALSSACSHIVPKEAKWATKVAETATKDVYQITPKAADSISKTYGGLIDTSNVSKIILEEPKKQGFFQDCMIKVFHKPQKVEGEDYSGILKRTDINCFNGRDMDHQTGFRIDSIKTEGIWENKDIERRYGYNFWGCSGYSKEQTTASDFGKDIQKIVDESNGDMKLSKRVSSSFNYFDMGTGKNIPKTRIQEYLSKFQIPSY